MISATRDTLAMALLWIQNSQSSRDIFPTKEAGGNTRFILQNLHTRSTAAGSVIRAGSMMENVNNEYFSE